MKTLARIVVLFLLLIAVLMVLPMQRNPERAKWDGIGLRVHLLVGAQDMPTGVEWKWDFNKFRPCSSAVTTNCIHGFQMDLTLNLPPAPPIPIGAPVVVLATSLPAPVVGSLSTVSAAFPALSDLGIYNATVFVLIRDRTGAVVKLSGGGVSFPWPPPAQNIRLVP